ncbi:hypothetical protein [Pedobacter nototheniae]|uniref:hypothetical protein n=1 Tax=Pedobacter nototheniae TaxID=2488994 RepID=UPI00103D4068|nr:hypothetical protein [Pedobacter nototheniae]
MVTVAYDLVTVAYDLVTVSNDLVTVAYGLVMVEYGLVMVEYGLVSLFTSFLTSVYRNNCIKGAKQIITEHNSLRGTKQSYD